jgi:diguanylate cyclase (GGDEF)-like protein
MFNMDPASLRHMLAELEQACHDHAQWHERFARTVVCRLPPDLDDLSEDAHLKCSFGQWYYQHPPAKLRDHPSFAAMEAEHERLHRAAARMLRAVASAATVVSSDFDEYMKAQDQLHLELDSLRHEIEGFLSNRDTLTGAHRRVDLLADLRESHELARRNVQECCIAFMDLDRFKPVNDTYGHRVGDQLLAAAVRFVMEHLRPFDKVFRYGGDEFLICMPGANLAAGRVVIERMREGLGALPLARGGATPIYVTASFGIALLDPDVSVEESIENADRALLAAKASGRNRACCWDPAATTASAMQPSLFPGVATD